MVSIKESLENVAKHPEMSTDIIIDVRVHELVARTLYEIANDPDQRVRGSLSRATKAQKLIFNRIVGTRRPGTHPAAREGGDIEFRDLTKGVLE